MSTRVCLNVQKYYEYTRVFECANEYTRVFECTEILCVQACL